MLFRSAEHFEQVGIDLEPDADLHNNVVDDAADAYAEQLERKVAKNLAEHGFTDNNGSQADHDSTAAHLDISKALVLAEQRLL